MAPLTIAMLWIVSLAQPVLAAGPCAVGVAGLLHTGGGRSAAQLILRDHIRPVKGGDKGGGYEVLVPSRAAGQWRLARAASYAEAERMALSRVSAPLDFDGAMARARAALPAFHGVLGELATSRNWTFRARLKERESLVRKSYGKARAWDGKFRLDDLNDLLGGRIVIPLRAGEDEALGAIKEQLAAAGYVVDFERHHNYESGYQAVHLTGASPEGARYEVQLLSERMDAWSGWEHDRIYKPRRPGSPRYLEKLRAYSRALREWVHADADPSVRLPDPKAFGISPEDAFRP